MTARHNGRVMGMGGGAAEIFGRRPDVKPAAKRDKAKLADLILKQVSHALLEEEMNSGWILAGPGIWERWSIKKAAVTQPESRMVYVYMDPDENHEDPWYYELGVRIDFPGYGNDPDGKPNPGEYWFVHHKPAAYKGGPRIPGSWTRHVPGIVMTYNSLTPIRAPGSGKPVRAPERVSRFRNRSAMMMAMTSVELVVTLLRKYDQAVVEAAERFAR
jgi:hypothetical protein